MPAPSESDLRAELTAAQEKLERVTSEYEQLRSDPDTLQEDRDAVHQFVAEATADVEAAAGAVARLESGVYGRCQQCGGSIGVERLEALPDTATCRDCS